MPIISMLERSDLALLHSAASSLLMISIHADKPVLMTGEANAAHVSEPLWMRIVPSATAATAAERGN